MMHDPPLLFAPRGGAAYGAAVAAAAGTSLAPMEEREFEDREHKSRPMVSVRDRDTFVILSLYGEAEQSAADKLVRLLFFIGTLRDDGAARVTAVCPYLAYSRKDRRTKPRDPVTTRYVAALFEAAGTDCVLTLDVHNLAAYENAFRCRTEHLEAAALFTGYLAPGLAETEVVVVAPDAGGIKRAEAFRQRLSRRLARPIGAASAEKYRSSGVVSGDALVGDVAGKVAIIVDDLISAGTTIARTAATCRDRGAKRVVAAVTHGVFATAAGATLGRSEVDTVIVTDTIPTSRVTDERLRAKLVELPTAPLVGAAIRLLHEGGSLTELREA